MADNGNNKKAKVEIGNYHFEKGKNMGDYMNVYDWKVPHNMKTSVSHWAMGWHETGDVKCLTSLGMALVEHGSNEYAKRLGYVYMHQAAGLGSDLACRYVGSWYLSGDFDTIKLKSLAKFWWKRAYHCCEIKMLDEDDRSNMGTEYEKEFGERIQDAMKDDGKSIPIEV